MGMPKVGTTTAYSWGDEIIPVSGLNWDGHLHNTGIDYKQPEMGMYDPNPWGFFDMHGNVWEWTADWYDATYPMGNDFLLF